MNNEKNITHQEEQTEFELNLKLSESRSKVASLMGGQILKLSDVEVNQVIEDYVCTLDEYLFNPGSSGYLGESPSRSDMTKIAASQIGIILLSYRELTSVEINEIHEWFDANNDEPIQSVRTFIGALLFLQHEQARHFAGVA